MNNNNFEPKDDLQAPHIVAPPITPPPGVTMPPQQNMQAPSQGMQTPPQGMQPPQPVVQLTPQPTFQPIHTQMPHQNASSTYPQYPYTQNGQNQPTNQPPVYSPGRGNGLPPLMPPPQPIPGDGFAVASLVLGVISISMLGSIIALIASILALIFGIIGRKRSSNATGKANKLATAGFILSLVALPLNTLYFTCNVCVGCVSDFSSILSDIAGNSDIQY